ncbi:RNA polymerase II elongation factor ELL2 isoform X2 [Esox lucius]|uniref:RNA polymerase II elongation factor ELL2 isoform X2 n=1 Tax=Esox lucius TaxID=8010 RepID=UPI00147735EF|nr:RNA polymerase II elongation factor ELL2 isoform X2 [Esox lucius]
MHLLQRESGDQTSHPIRNRENPIPSVWDSEASGGFVKYIKIPAHCPDSPAALRVFSFYLSSDSKDQPQASLHCVHQHVSSSGQEVLADQGSIQDKVTVCATEESYQTTRERLSQVEKDTWSRAAIQIKPGETQKGKCVKLQRKPSTVSAPDSLQKQLSPSGPRRSSAPVPGLTSAAPRPQQTPGCPLREAPLKERIIHLLALKSYSKPELLLWLDKERASPKDKGELGSVLEEVAKLNPKDSRYLLKEDFYRVVQRDWPGYSDDERQTMNRLLARKLLQHHSSQSQRLSLQSSLSFHKLSNDSPVDPNPFRTMPLKRPVLPDPSDDHSQKRQRLLDQRLPPTNAGQMHRKSSSSLNSGLHSQTSTSTHVLQSQDGFPLLHKLKSLSSLHGLEQVEPDLKPSSPDPPRTDSDSTVCQPQQITNSQQRKKKNKKHKEKERERVKDCQTSEEERERVKDFQGSEAMDTCPDVKNHSGKLAKTHMADVVPCVEEKPDYLLMYGSICSPEQRQRYQEEFCSEYDEYRDLHGRIASITHMFIQLGSKMETLPPGSPEHKVMQEQILEKYKRYRKKFPGYRDEKKRCQYLHHKLAHIKQLIQDYDDNHTL